MKLAVVENKGARFRMQYLPFCLIDRRRRKIRVEFQQCLSEAISEDGLGVRGTFGIEFSRSNFRSERGLVSKYFEPSECGPFDNRFRKVADYHGRLHTRAALRFV